MASNSNAYLFFSRSTTTIPVEQFLDVNTINYDDDLFATNKVSFDTDKDIFTINGKLTANQIRNYSDIRLKKDIVPIENALERLLQLQGKEYKLKSTEEPHYGFIAQDVQTVIPSIVNSDDGYLNLAYIELIPFLVESIKQLYTINISLNERIATLDAKLSIFDRKLSSLMRKFE